MKAEPGQDSLEPSLLDRLLDDERTVGTVSIELDPACLAEHRADPEAVFDALERRGWQRASGEGANGVFHVPRADASPARCLAIEVPVGDGQRLPLERLGQASVRFAMNSRLENPEQRHLSAGRLRAAITRDLGVLLNTLSLDATQDLDKYPEVRKSVLNYGMPALVGRAVSGVDTQATARRIEAAIACFEPRLSGVTVAVNSEDEVISDSELRFEIEAQMWSYPSMQHVLLDTRIDIDSGDVRVVDRG